MPKTYRIGQIVPSSNTTMETEVPRMLLARQTIRPEQFTFHSSRMAMKHVTKEELAAMDAQSVGCARQLADAEVDIIGYVTEPLAENTSSGALVVIEIAPPMVLRPNSVPCGPRSTSIRSKSTRSRIAPTERAT